MACGFAVTSVTTVTKKRAIPLAPVAQTVCSVARTLSCNLAGGYHQKTSYSGYSGNGRSVEQRLRVLRGEGGVQKITRRPPRRAHPFLTHFPSRPEVCVVDYELKEVAACPSLTGRS